MRLTRRGTGHDSALWPVLLLLLVVLVPSAGVVWMMRAAMENERLAVRQRLSDAYEVQLESVRRSIHDAWRDRLAQLERHAEEERPGRAFQLARASGVDSVVIFDEAGDVAYPTVAAAVEIDAPDSADWQRAERWEFVELKPKEAAEAYATIASAAVDPAVAARARQSQARSLAKADDRDGAVQVLQQLRGDGAVTDAHGRSIAADAELRLLELLDRDGSEWRKVAESLSRRLEDYDQPMLPADQRRFLMRELQSLDARFEPRYLDAEELAAELVAEPLEPVVPGVFQPTPLSNVLQLRSPGGRVIALVRESSLLESLTDMLAEQTFPAGVVVVARPPENSAGTASDLVTESLSPTLPGWRLALGMSDGSTFDAAADARMAFFFVDGDCGRSDHGGAGLARGPDAARAVAAHAAQERFGGHGVARAQNAARLDSAAGRHVARHRRHTRSAVWRPGSGPRVSGDDR